MIDLNTENFVIAIWMFRSFPKNISVTWATEKLLHNAHNSRYLLAESLFSEHHIFMQTFAKRR